MHQQGKKSKTKKRGKKAALLPQSKLDINKNFLTKMSNF